MLRSILTIISTALAMILFAAPSFSQSLCGERAEIVKRLHSGFQEQRRSAGLATNGNLVETFVSKSGSWTILFTKPGGPTCLIAAGENWQKIKEPLNHTRRIL